MEKRQSLLRMPGVRPLASYCLLLSLAQLFYTATVEAGLKPTDTFGGKVPVAR